MIKNINQAVPLFSNNQLKLITNKFLNELHNAVKENSSSISYLTNPPPSSIIHNDEIFQVMIVGGSVFEKTLVQKKGKNINILQLIKSHVPVFDSKNTFLDFIYQNTDLSVQYVAINFTYPIRPVFENNLLDGVLIKATKEHSFKGLIDKIIGKEISQYVKQKSGENILFTLANDTICLLLAGINKDHSFIAGGIIGTGINFGFYNKKEFVNLESGNFNGFPQTKTGLQIDKESNNPNYQLFEKEVSGQYLYKHFNVITKQIKDNISLSSTSQLNDFALGKNGVNTLIAQRLFERSASLVACQIAGTYHHLNQVQLTFVMEGSIFWTGWNYKKMVEEHLVLLGIPQNTVRFIKIEHSNILGAAKLVCGI
ncbi:hypothetical protein AUK04_05070 [Candidatus Roizmanbacteria bacterium CG2_30_33_16]|uniref:Hexokinase C-terminal domain-containing protein n=5 Tax=Candidatus Roizmaniibacteriota TaxID=1752723 RepID=A0A2M7E5G0_9BACT|nr:hypothetical protein [Candidatus Roizmanbacteria bacterium]OIP82195.1 MAG: hypothetical protein AUK04_05070 [Candidatus Roizmanbacteria bacterium CG2_30_33_16]PIP64376.1 MAG: hypothetical protein COW96_02905 [Candidatus Roizmanbacteria bacterium CG22_combo_CG10-13_8_21_14_all_33_16]PIV62951.1 MAG: hypothetical protein COS12_00470 [Candidatus Roizmanbacteria bacterium CG01_land_8_20_14_3_00_33_9]PIX69343.1 MAG: hypothetical protein COZ39_05370 [Candidatus Roizmanbacteria bacterium CG_4_10_14_